MPDSSPRRRWTAGIVRLDPDGPDVWLAHRNESPVAVITGKDAAKSWLRTERARARGDSPT